MLRYNPRLKGRARSLRANPTDAEQRLWARLRRQQILGVQLQTKANRQLYCRFLRTRRTTRCGDRRRTTLRAFASRTRQASHKLPEPDVLTSVTLLRPRGSAGAGFRSRGDLSNRGGKKSPS